MLEVSEARRDAVQKPGYAAFGLLGSLPDAPPPLADALHRRRNGSCPEGLQKDLNCVRIKVRCS